MRPSLEPINFDIETTVPDYDIEITKDTSSRDVDLDCNIYHNGGIVCQFDLRVNRYANIIHNTFSVSDSVLLGSELDILIKALQISRTVSEFMIKSLKKVATEDINNVDYTFKLVVE